jgi:hypothetical protein
VSSNGCEGDHCAQLAQQISENILGRAQKDLEDAVRADDPGQIKDKIATYSAEAKVEVAAIQERLRQPLESVAATELSKEDVDQIRVLSANSYKDESSEFQSLIAVGLEKALLNPVTKFYIERGSDDGVIFFDRFDDNVDHETGAVKKYFGSVVAGEAHGGIGRARIPQTLEQELAGGETMYAHSDPENNVSQLYIEHGFVATGTVSPAGKFSFELWRSVDSSNQFVSKGVATADLLIEIDAPDKYTAYVVREVESGDQFPELHEGQYLTRYFRHNGQRYAVFEEAPSALQAEFLPPQDSRIDPEETPAPDYRQPNAA